MSTTERSGQPAAAERSVLQDYCDQLRTTVAKLTEERDKVQLRLRQAHETLDRCGIPRESKLTGFMGM